MTRRAGTEQARTQRRQRGTVGPRAGKLGTAMTVVAAALVIGATVGVPAADADAEAQTQSLPRTSTTVAIDALTGTSNEDARASIPSGFVDSFYSPTIQNGVLVAPDGDCSSPIPLPSEFDTACKAHDLGYDLLRFGSATGAPSTRDARRELDARFAETTHDSCSSRSGIGSRTVCYAMSEVAAGAVEFNSWRQHFRTPDSEPMLPYLVTGSLVGVALLAASCTASAVAPRRRRATA
nr:hypothetical protein [Rhodococcus sp. (in: high G+C Gram-positive bacteria)]